MRTMKILERLDRLLAPDLSKNKKTRELQQLLERLEGKKQKFDQKLERAASLAERAELVRKQRICAEQIERGRRALEGCRGADYRF